jgi:hypothetical protein
MPAITTSIRNHRKLGEPFLESNVFNVFVNYISALFAVKSIFSRS